jgi:DNA-binding NarL/FixJ family response regulator
LKTVCIVDDQAIVIDALTTIIEDSKDVAIVGSFGAAEEFVDNYDTLLPDVTVMDLDLPGMSGIEAIVEIKKRYPKSKFLVLTNYDDNDRLFKALEAGADGYLLKKKSLQNLLASLDLVYLDGAPMTPEITKKVIAYFKEEPRNKNQDFQQLTERETMVLQLLAEGFLYKEIAEKLSIGIDAIKKHTQHIYAKLHVSTRSEAIKKYLTR